MLVLTAFPVLSHEAFAALRASFSLDACSWHATHIVVATEGEKIDGVLMLQDETLVNRYGEVVEAFAKAGGRSVGPELTELIKQELVFWKKTAPNLKVGWWNGAGLDWSEVEPLRNRYGKILEAFYALRKIHFVGCKTAVTEFRDFWRSLPQLEDKRGLDSMSEACDAVLKELAK